MTERKPPNMSVETWIDRQIQEATERGAFENLPPLKLLPLDVDEVLRTWHERHPAPTPAATAPRAEPTAASRPGRRWLRRRPTG